MLLTWVRMLIARSWLAMRSAKDEYGGSGVILSTSKPSATPASDISCLARARSKAGAHLQPDRPRLHRCEPQFGIATNRVQQLARHQIGDVRVTGLEQRDTGRVFGDAAHHDRLDVGRLAPVLGKGFELHLGAGLL